MRVFVLGGTGSIGGSVVAELARRGHEVIALARSEAAAKKVSSLGAAPMAGDLTTPEQWVSGLPPLDAAVHVAATFSSDEAEINQRLLQHLLPHLSSAARKVRFVYTGGCWLFGPFEGTVATEETPFDPIPLLAWCVPHIRQVLNTPGVDAIVIHPAMVYDSGGGVFVRFRRDAETRDSVRIVVDENIRWPLVHGEDLATLYALALEKGLPGESYIGAAIEGLPVGRIARAFARRFGTAQAEPEIMTESEIRVELGDWLQGHARDQRLSGDKAIRCLGWQPSHCDPESEIAAIP
jgi:nucleoside-diphosphate-sugar epimerase